MSWKPAASIARTNRNHFRMRLYERFGLRISDGDIARIEAAIRSGELGPDCVPVRVDRGVTIYAVRLQSVWVPVVYRHSVASVVTALPSQRLDPYRSILDPVSAP